MAERPVLGDGGRGPDSRSSSLQRTHTYPLQGVTPVTSRILPRDLAFQGVTQGVTKA